MIAPSPNSRELQRRLPATAGQVLYVGVHSAQGKRRQERMALNLTREHSMCSKQPLPLEGERVRRTIKASGTIHGRDSRFRHTSLHAHANCFLVLSRNNESVELGTLVDVRPLLRDSLILNNVRRLGNDPTRVNRCDVKTLKHNGGPCRVSGAPWKPRTPGQDARAGLLREARKRSAKANRRFDSCRYVTAGVQITQ